jgi:hypothetical protein
MAHETSTQEWLLGGGGLVTLGGGIVWAWNAIWARADKRQRELDARAAKLDEEEAQAVLDMKGRLNAIEGALVSMGEQLEQHRLALHILVAKVAREDPAAPELEQVANILGNAFPVHLHIPADMADAINRIDKGAAA